MTSFHVGACRSRVACVPTVSTLPSSQSVSQQQQLLSTDNSTFYVCPSFLPSLHNSFHRRTPPSLDPVHKDRLADMPSIALRKPLPAETINAPSSDMKAAPQLVYDLKLEQDGSPGQAKVVSSQLACVNQGTV